MNQLEQITFNDLISELIVDEKLNISDDLRGRVRKIEHEINEVFSLAEKNKSKVDDDLVYRINSLKERVFELKGKIEEEKLEQEKIESSNKYTKHKLYLKNSYIDLENSSFEYAFNDFIEEDEDCDSEILAEEFDYIINKEDYNKKFFNNYYEKKLDSKLLDKKDINKKVLEKLLDLKKVDVKESLVVLLTIVAVTAGMVGFCMNEKILSLIMFIVGCVFTGMFFYENNGRVSIDDEEKKKRMFFEYCDNIGFKEISANEIEKNIKKEVYLTSNFYRKEDLWNIALKIQKKINER